MASLHDIARSWLAPAQPRALVCNDQLQEQGRVGPYIGGVANGILFLVSRMPFFLGTQRVCTPAFNLFKVKEGYSTDKI